VSAANRTNRHSCKSGSPRFEPGVHPAALRRAQEALRFFARLGSERPLPYIIPPKTWYYSQNNQRIGPVDDAEFRALVAEGKITADTLVWREGMPNWISYSQRERATPSAAVATAGTGMVPPGTVGAAPCVECGRTFPVDEMVSYEGRYICPQCKPIFFQKVKEGALVAGNLNYAGFWIRFLAYLLDVIILQVFLYLFGMILGMVLGGADTVQLIATVVSFVLALGYEIFFIGKYGATPGKMALKLRVVRADGSPVGYGLAAGRYLSKILSALILLIGYIMAAFDEQKRALHDRICDTRVVRE
jgi:uncharacterized RDD family membrane protein YckC